MLSSKSMKSSNATTISVVTFLSIGVFFGSAAADDSSAVIEPVEGKRLLVPPNGIAPLVGIAAAVSKDADDSREYAWSLRLHVPKVVWEITGKERPKREWSRIKADVEMLTLDVQMGYSEATQLSEGSQNRLVDLNGKRLSREEALKRLAENAPVLVSVSGEMPDPFYLRCSKRDTLIVLFGLPSSREYNLLPTSRATRRQAEQDDAVQPATAADSKPKGDEKPNPASQGRSQ